MEPIVVGNESPPARQSILGSFLRGRPRGVSQSHPAPTHDGPQPARDSPPPTNAQDVPGHRRRPAAVQPSVSQSLQPSSSLSGSSPFQMLRRRRSASALASNTTPQIPTAIAVARTTAAASTNMPPVVGGGTLGPTHRIRLVPHLDSRRSLRFDPICRDVREGEAPLRIGRFTDRSGLGLAAANALGSNKLAFKSKVVSRAHAEIWVEVGGKFYIRDTKSSSGTFLNHVRLSPANTESRQNELKDGDLLQLGVDYQGGTEDIYKCVKIRIEVGREWQSHSNPFNSNALKQLQAIAIPAGSTAPKKISAGSKSALSDCCICLFGVTIRQALFIAPCSHAFHYKCIRPLLDSHHPSFNCPLCRTYANLDEDVEIEMEPDEDSIDDAAVLAASLATPVIPESSRERDAGAETEVEQDGPFRLGPNLRRRAAPPFPGGNDMAEDVDEEMEDASNPLPALPEDLDDVELESASQHRDMSASPVSLPRGANRSTEFLFEADEASGSGEADAGISDGSGVGEAVINGKRKR